MLGVEVKFEAEKYNRFIVNKILFHTESYSRMYKRSNNVAKVGNEKFLSVQDLLRINTTEGNSTFVIIGQEYEVLNEPLILNGKFDSAKYSFVVQKTNNIVAYSPELISKKCIVIPCEENIVLFELVNAFETD